MSLFDKLGKFIASLTHVDNSTTSVAQNKSNTNKKTLREKSDSIGIDLSSVINAPKIKNILTDHAIKTCSEISAIPSEYHDKLAKAVLDNFYGTLPEGVSLLQQMSSIYQLPKKEAKQIAIDLSSKLTARLNQARQEENGVKEYIWRAVGDSCNHLSRHKKKYRWSQPPSGGHPGQSYLCGCYAEAVINLQATIRNARKQP